MYKNILRKGGRAGFVSIRTGERILITLFVFKGGDFREPGRST